MSGYKTLDEDQARKLIDTFIDEFPPPKIFELKTKPEKDAEQIIDKNRLRKVNEIAQSHSSASPAAVDFTLETLLGKIDEMKDILRNLAGENPKKCASGGGNEIDDKDYVEGLVAAKFHEVLNECTRLNCEHLEPERCPKLEDSGALEDQGFWRYLSLGYFWWFIYWRESSSKSFLPYIAGSRQRDHVLRRMYLRAELTYTEEDGYDLCIATHQSRDFWASHVLSSNVRYGPELVRALVRFDVTLNHNAKKNPCGRSRQEWRRELAKIMARKNTNLVLAKDIYTDSEADQIITEAVNYLEKNFSSEMYDTP